jgi:DNA-binding SARP family transcriptional activator/WD40 repeat protein
VPGACRWGNSGVTVRLTGGDGGRTLPGVGVAVLGPVSVDGDAEGLGPRDRVVLAALALRPGEAVSAERLADALWGERPPVTWPKVIHGCVARLRKVLGAAAIETVRPGYRLVLSGDEVDAQRFERLVQRGRELLTLGETERAAHVIGEALALWRGPALVELEGWTPGRIEAARLEELRLDAQEVQLEAALRAGRYREVLAELQARVAEAPLRERRWALLALAQYQAGRQGEALRTLHRARTVLAGELGVDPGPDLVALEAAILRQDPSLVAEVALPEPSATCPYLGLVPYDVADADAFFGRDADVAGCLRRLATVGVLAVVGPSGSGKSSLVRAGVAAALERDGRRVVVVSPGAHPGDALTVLPEGAVVPALVVDQCEEAVTLCHDREEQARFFGALAAHAERAPLVVVLRADRLGELSAHPGFARLIEPGLYLLGAMGEADLRAAIQGPAHQAGLLLEAGLIELLVREVEGEAGRLPLLSHALRTTWERREGRTLTVDGYRASGGIGGAVAQSAEALYEGVPPDQRPLLRDLLLRLLAPGPDGGPIRRRLPRRIVATDPAHEELIELLVGARLVTSDDGVVELAHEALARAWPRLRDWLDEDVEGQHVLRHLTGAADTWDAMGRPDSELYRGARLAQALDWRQRAHPDLTLTERAFLDAGHDLADTERRAAHNAQISNLAALARTLGSSQLDLALLLGVEAHRLEPTVETEGALQTALAHTPPGLEQVIRPDSPTVRPAVDPTGRLLAVPRADGAVRLLSWPSLAEVRTLRGRESPAQVVVFSRDGSHLVVGGGGGPVDVWDLTSGRRSGVAVDPGGYPGFGFFVGSDPADTSRLATVGSTGTAGEVVLWDRSDVERPRRIGQPLGFELGNRNVPFAAASDDGTLLAAGGYLGPTTRVWDVRTRALLQELPGAPGPFVPGTHILTTAQNDRIDFWDAPSGTPAGDPLTDPGRDGDPYQLAGGPYKFSPDGLLLAALDYSGARVFDLDERCQTGPLLRLDAPDMPISFLPDGRLLTSGPEALGVWRLGTTDPPYATTLAGHTGVTYGQLIAGTHNALTTGIDDHRLLSWDITTSALRGPLLAGEAREFSAVSPDGAYIAAPTIDRGATGIWDVGTGERVATFDGGRGDDQVALWSPAGDLVATMAAADDAVRVWDVADHRHPALVQRLTVENATIPAANGSLYGFFSRDGRLLATVDTPQFIPDATSRTSTLTVFDIATGHTMWSKRLSGLVSQAAFAPDGATLATKHGDLIVGESFVTLWDTADGTARSELDVPAGGFGVEFLRGGDTLITTGRTDAEDRRGAPTRTASAQLWDLTTLQPIGEPLPLSPRTGGYISRDAEGTTAVIGTTDGVAVVWNVDPEHWESLACMIAGRNLTPAEWDQYVTGQPYRATCPQWPDPTD